jgi:hypothetical protein
MACSRLAETLGLLVFWADASVVVGGPPMEIAMRLTTILASLALAGLVSGEAMAATATAPATAPATTAPMKKAATPMTPEKTAISKQCSSLADAKALHGKDREKFRAACKKNGGKAPT